MSPGSTYMPNLHGLIMFDLWLNFILKKTSSYLILYFMILLLSINVQFNSVLQSFSILFNPFQSFSPMFDQPRCFRFVLDFLRCSQPICLTTHRSAIGAFAFTGDAITGAVGHAITDTTWLSGPSDDAPGALFWYENVMFFFSVFFRGVVFLLKTVSL